MIQSRQRKFSIVRQAYKIVFPQLIVTIHDFHGIFHLGQSSTVFHGHCDSRVYHRFVKVISKHPLHLLVKHFIIITNKVYTRAAFFARVQWPRKSPTTSLVVHPVSFGNVTANKQLTLHLIELLERLFP